MRKLAHWLIRRLAARYGLGMTTQEASRFILYQDDYRPVKAGKEALKKAASIASSTLRGKYGTV